MSWVYVVSAHMISLHIHIFSCASAEWTVSAENPWGLFCESSMLDLHILDEYVNVYFDYVYEVEISATDYRNRSMHFGFISKHQCMLKVWAALLKLICFIILFSPLWLFFRCACTTDVSVADTSMKLCSPLWLFFGSIFTLETCVGFFSELQRYSFRN